jgi:hypothetical protein
MEPQEVASIVRQQSSAFGGGERQHLTIRHGGVCVSGIERGQDVVPQPAELYDELQRNVLV